jgi:hypothetical protein
MKTINDYVGLYTPDECHDLTFSIIADSTSNLHSFWVDGLDIDGCTRWKLTLEYGVLAIWDRDRNALVAEHLEMNDFFRLNGYEPPLLARVVWSQIQDEHRRFLAAEAARADLEFPL